MAFHKAKWSPIPSGHVKWPSIISAQFVYSYIISISYVRNDRYSLTQANIFITREADNQNVTTDSPSPYHRLELTPCDGKMGRRYRDRKKLLGFQIVANLHLTHPKNLAKKKWTHF